MMHRAKSNDSTPPPRIGDLSPDRTHYWNGDIWGWQPLWLVPDDIMAIAAERFGRPAIDATFLASGLLNQSWRLDTAQGAYVLRVSRPERTRPQIAYEHVVLAALQSRIGAVVPPLPGTDGQTVQPAREYCASLFPFVVGSSGVDVPATVRSHAAAQMLARIHRITARDLFLPQRPGFRSVDEHPRWVWRKVKPILHGELAGSPEFARLSEAIEVEIAQLDTGLDALVAASRLQPRAIVHGDFNPRNLLLQDDQVVAVIDWDDCHVEPIVWEVAQAAVAPHVDPRAFWQTYLDAGGPLTARGVALLGGFARIGALNELQWTLDEHNHATPHALQQLRDVVRDLARLREREAAAMR